VARAEAGKAWSERWVSSTVVLRGEREDGGDVSLISALLFRGTGGGSAGAGSSPRVTVMVKGVRGRKNMTFVVGCSTFGVPPAALARDLSRRLAASASVVPLAEADVHLPAWMAAGGAVGDLERVAVQVQGGDADAVVTALTTPIASGGWGLAPGWVVIKD
jgi:translation initiation factor 1 (eIF-1/SUI1)